MTSPYWNGTRKAELTQQQITAAWGRGSFWVRRMNLVNQIFEFWFNARRNIGLCTDAPHRQAMTTELENAGRTGHGVIPGNHGIDDLEEVFLHIVQNNGGFTSNDTRDYFGGPGNLFWPSYNIELPKGVKEFATEVQSNFAEVRTAMEGFGQSVETINRQVSAAQTDWNQVATALTYIKNTANTAKNFMWARPRVVDALGRTGSYANALGNIHSGLTTYASMPHDTPENARAAIGVLSTAVRFIPVLGSYYGGMVDLIPRARAWFAGTIQERVRRIDRFLSMR